MVPVWCTQHLRRITLSCCFFVFVSVRLCISWVMSFDSYNVMHAVILLLGRHSVHSVVALRLVPTSSQSRVRLFWPTRDDYLFLTRPPGLMCVLHNHCRISLKIPYLDLCISASVSARQTWLECDCVSWPHLVSHSCLTLCLTTDRSLACLVPAGQGQPVLCDGLHSWRRSHVTAHQVRHL